MDGNMLFDMRHDHISLNFQKEIKGRQKITFRALFLLFLNGITSNPAKYQLGALDGWTHAVRYVT